KLAGYRTAGVNRLSLGVQSLDDSILPRLGRLHDARGARAAFEAAREAGCDNLSVDLMYGLPGLDLDGWTRAVEAVLDWQPDHLSAYGLTLDAGSLWGAAGIEGLPTEDTQVDQYWRLARAAAARGLEHYEISNYARRGSMATPAFVDSSTSGGRGRSWSTRATACDRPRPASPYPTRSSSNCYNFRQWMPVIATCSWRSSARTSTPRSPGARGFWPDRTSRTS